MRQAGLFRLSDHLKRLSAFGDPLEELARIVNFEVFRPALVVALACGDGAKGGRPPYDLVAMLKVLILPAHTKQLGRGEAGHCDVAGDLAGRGDLAPQFFTFGKTAPIVPQDGVA